MLYNVVLFSTVQQSGEYADIYPFLFGFLILMGLETVIRNEVAWSLFYLCSSKARFVVVSNSFASPWSLACWAPLSMGFPRQESGEGCHFFLQGIFLTQGSTHVSCKPMVDALSRSHLGIILNLTGRKAGELTKE